MVDRSSAMVHNQGRIVGFVAKNNENLIRFEHGADPDVHSIMDFATPEVVSIMDFMEGRPEGLEEKK